MPLNQTASPLIMISAETSVLITNYKSEGKTDA